MPEASIFPRYSFTSSKLAPGSLASAVYPIIAFMGVRISCDMFERNIDFALFRSSACILRTFDSMVLLRMIVNMLYMITSAETISTASTSVYRSIAVRAAGVVRSSCVITLCWNQISDVKSIRNSISIHMIIE